MKILIFNLIPLYIASGACDTATEKIGEILQPLLPHANPISAVWRILSTLNECNAILAQNRAKEKGLLNPGQLAPFVQPVPFLIAIQPAGGGFAVPSVLSGTAVVLQPALGSLRVNDDFYNPLPPIYGAKRLATG